jgi:hypothetical protein
MQRRCLLGSNAPLRRATTDALVQPLGFASSQSGHQPAKWTLKRRDGQTDDGRIGKEVAQKRLNISQFFRSA